MRKLIFLTLLLAIFGLGAQAAKGQMAGGYNPAKKNDPQVRAAAKYAVAAENQKIRPGVLFILIAKAEQQVVAGMNYKMCLKVRNGKRVRYATAVVYRNLKGKHSLTSWDWGECNW
jgi:hypothetical protein